MANNNIHRKKDSASLVWDTKPRRAPNPKDIEFQTAEVVIPNPHRDEAQIPLSFRDGLFGEEEIDKQKMNRLIWGDNLLAMQALLAQGYEGKINLIYIDPPFDSKADYSHRMIIEGNEFTKEPSVIERLAYKDTWAGGTDSYLDMLYPRLQLMKRLLAEDGTIYVHCDWRMNSYIRCLLDEIFGKENYRTEIRWRRQPPRGTKAISRQFARSSDSILMYSKTERMKWNLAYKSYSEEYIKSKFKKDGEGRLYRIDTIGTYSEESIRKFEAFGRIYHYPSGKIGLIRYLDEAKGEPVSDIWTDIPEVNSQALERCDFDTQKPESLLKRIIEASTDEGDLVADFFSGSGTTFAVAEKLGRRWIGCELGKVGVQVTRSRLVEMEAKPFLIENIGNYQREMIYLTGGRIWEMQHLILKLYGATPRDKASGLGVRKAPDGMEELVYVGYPDRPVTAKKTEELALQAQNLMVEDTGDW